MSAGHRPLFSILIPSYNRPEYITECINSVLANEGEDYELIISDDASPTADAIEDAVRPYLARSNIRFHKLRTNLGEPGNRNFLVSQATGEYNVILGDDDKLVAHALRTIRQYIKDYPSQDLYGFGYAVIDEKGMPCYSRYAPKGFAINLDHPELVRRMFEATWLPFLVCHPATFCCKRGVEAEIPYRQDVSTADDYMFLLECINKGKRLYVLPECLLTYRWFQSGETTRQVNQSADSMTVIRAYIKVYYALQGQTDLHPSLSKYIHGRAYRNRFLYDLIIRRMQMTEDSIALLKLEQAHYHELVEYGATPWRYMVLIKTPFTVLYELMQHFGLQGLLYWLRLGLAYLKYRVLRVSVCSPG